jgi:uncharacterized protein YbbK (DUF523 family)
MFLVSACLAGYPCRYDGNSNRDDRIVELVRHGKAIPVCPEQLGGLTTPRKPAERQFNADEPFKVLNIDGEDVTDAFNKGAQIVLDIARKYSVSRAILKQNSPSCGNGRIYDGSFSGKLIDGHGVTTALLTENGLEVVSEEELN